MKLEDVLAGTFDISKLSDLELGSLGGVYRILTRPPEDNKDKRLILWHKMGMEITKEIISRRKLICSVCGKSASWNTPYIDKELNVYCSTCAGEAKDKMLYGIGQHIRGRDNFETDPRQLHYQKNGITLCADVIYYGIKGRVSIYRPEFYYHCWVDNGKTSYPIKDDEKLIAAKNPEELLDKIWHDIYNGLYRCTTCGCDLDEPDIAGRPLFSGLCCKGCWQKHLDHLEEERKRGHVCRMCGQPYGNCCC